MDEKKQSDSNIPPVSHENDAPDEKIKLVINNESALKYLSKILAKETNKIALDIVLIPAITFVGGLLAVIAALYVNSADHKQNRIMEQINLEVKRIRQDKLIKIKQSELFNAASIEMRAARLYEISACNLGLRSTKEQKLKFIQLRLTARAKTIRASLGLKEIFDDMPGIENDAKTLTFFDESVLDVCAKDAPSDDAWKKIQLGISKKMEESIKNSVNELTKLEKEVNFREE